MYICFIERKKEKKLMIYEDIPKKEKRRKSYHKSRDPESFQLIENIAHGVVCEVVVLTSFVVPLQVPLQSHFEVLRHDVY